MEEVFRQWGIPLFLSVKALRSGIYRCLQREFRIEKDLQRESPNQNQRLVWKTPQTPKTPKTWDPPPKKKNGKIQKIIHKIKKTKTPKLSFFLACWFSHGFLCFEFLGKGFALQTGL